MANWVPAYTVHLDGKELPKDDDVHLQSITVDLRRQAPASVELVFNNHEGKYDARADLGPGTQIKIGLGYTEGGTKQVFEGEIIGTHVRLKENGPRLFVARAFDYQHRMTRGRKTRTFLERKFSDIVKEVAGDSGLSPECEDTTFSREYVIQHNQSDLDFTRGIAAWLDFDFHIRHLDGAKKLRFKAPEVTAKPIVKAVYEKPNLTSDEVHLRRFDGRQSLARVVSEVVVRGWDPSQKKEIVGRAKAGQLYDKMGDDASATETVKQKWGETERQLVDYKVFTQDEADKIALTKLNEYARTFIRADLEVQGFSGIHPGGVVEVSRVGERFDGPYFVESVSHVFTASVQTGGGYTTRFVAQRCGW
jgi:phage protein D